MDTLKPPQELCLTGNISDNWKRFKQRIELYMDATGASKKDDKAKTSLLLHVMGEKAIDVYNTFVFQDAGDEMKYNKVIEQFEAYCSPKKNITLERFHFNRCTQEKDESIDQYVTKLKALSKTCEFGTLENSLVKDRIVFGIQSDATRERLLREEDLTLEKAMKVCRAAESAKIQMSEIGAENTVHAVKSQEKTNKFGYKQYQFKKQKSSKTKQQGKQQSDQVHSCRRCGKTHKSGECPAYGQECLKCGGKNHYAKCCLSKKQAPGKKKVHRVDLDLEEDTSSEEFILHTVSVDAVTQDNCDWTEDIIIHGKRINMKLDTGAQVNLLSESEYRKLRNKPKLQRTKHKLKGYGNYDIQIIGKFVAHVEHNGKHRMTFFVVPGADKPLLGLEACERLGLVKRVADVKKDTYEALKEEYKELFEGLGCLPGQHTIVVDPTVPPVVHACRKVPFALHDKLKEELRRMVDLKVITKVNEPTEWVSSVVIVKKSNGDLRICLDPRSLNQAIRRQHYKLPTREEVMAQFAGAKIFTKLDASKGFWQVQLDEASSYKCTFNTPFGRFRYLRLPFGISSAPEVYHKIVHEIFEGISGVDTSMDDIIVWGNTKKEHDVALERVLQAARKNNLKLNPDKCMFGVKELTFLGGKLTDQGVKPDPKKISAITNMERPKDKQEVQRFLGMVTYLAKWIPGFSEKTTPLRSLLHKNNAWQWGPEQETAWEHLKNLITTEPVLQYYDRRKPIRISLDASRNGLGAVLLQLHQEIWKPVAYASRAMIEAETRYAQLEKELLSITFACERFHQFIDGAEVVAETDHKPLVSIFKKSLVDCPLRVQKLLLRIQRYDLEVTYTPGKLLVAADTLSRATDPKHPKGIDSSTAEEIDLYVDMVMKSIPISEKRMIQIKEETQKDEKMKTLIRIIQEGWPNNKRNCLPEVTDYWNVRESLSVQDGIVLKGLRVVIPPAMRSSVLSKIHEGHLGIEKCRRRARDLVYWPGLNSDVTQLVNNCSTCMKYSSKQQQENLQPHEIPTCPSQKIGADLFTYDNKDYLVVCDYYSNFPEITSLSKTTSAAVICAMKSMLARFGTVDILVTDNGPQFSSSEFKKFTEDWEIQHITSSPYYAKSNGLAESSVKTAKNILKKCVDSGQDIYKGLLAYRSSPLESGLSPAQLLMGRRIKTTLPAHQKMYQSNNKDLVKKMKMQKLKQKEYYDRQSCELPKLSVGDRVCIHDHSTGEWRQRATVVEEVAPRSYNLKTDDGVTYRRNRIDIKRFDSTPTTTTDIEISADDSGRKELQQEDSTVSIQDQNQAESKEQPVLPRRGERIRVPRKRLIESM